MRDQLCQLQRDCDVTYLVIALHCADHRVDELIHVGLLPRTPLGTAQDVVDVDGKNYDKVSMGSSIT